MNVIPTAFLDAGNFELLEQLRGSFPEPPPVDLLLPVSGQDGTNIEFASVASNGLELPFERLEKYPGMRQGVPQRCETDDYPGDAVMHVNSAFYGSSFSLDSSVNVGAGGPSTLIADLNGTSTPTTVSVPPGRIWQGSFASSEAITSTWPSREQSAVTPAHEVGSSVMAFHKSFDTPHSATATVSRPPAAVYAGSAPAIPAHAGRLREVSSHRKSRSIASFLGGDSGASAAGALSLPAPPGCVSSNLASAPAAAFADDATAARQAATPPHRPTPQPPPLLQQCPSWPRERPLSHPASLEVGCSSAPRPSGQPATCPTAPQPADPTQGSPPPAASERLGTNRSASPCSAAPPEASNRPDPTSEPGPLSPLGEEMQQQPQRPLSWPSQHRPSPPHVLPLSAGQQHRQEAPLGEDSWRHECPTLEVLQRGVILGPDLPNADEPTHHKPAEESPQRKQRREQPPALASALPAPQLPSLQPPQSMPDQQPRAHKKRQNALASPKLLLLSPAPPAPVAPRRGSAANGHAIATAIAAATTASGKPLPNPVAVTVALNVQRPPVRRQRQAGRKGGRKRSLRAGGRSDTGDGSGTEEDEDGAAPRRGQRGGRGGAGGGTNPAGCGGAGGGVVGVFHPARYMASVDCIQVGSVFVSRSRFEKLGGSPMAKWYRSIRVLDTGDTLGHWLTRHGLPVFTGKARQSRRRNPNASAASAAEEASDQDPADATNATASPCAAADAAAADGGGCTSGPVGAVSGADAGGQGPSSGGAGAGSCASGEGNGGSVGPSREETHSPTVEPAAGAAVPAVATHAEHMLTDGGADGLGIPAGGWGAEGAVLPSETIHTSGLAEGQLWEVPFSLGKHHRRGGMPVMARQSGDGALVTAVAPVDGDGTADTIPVAAAAGGLLAWQRDCGASAAAATAGWAATAWDLQQEQAAAGGGNGRVRQRTADTSRLHSSDQQQPPSGALQSAGIDCGKGHGPGLPGTADPGQHRHGSGGGRAPESQLQQHLPSGSCSMSGYFQQLPSGAQQAVSQLQPPCRPQLSSQPLAPEACYRNAAVISVDMGTAAAASTSGPAAGEQQQLHRGGCLDAAGALRCGFEAGQAQAPQGGGAPMMPPTPQKGRHAPGGNMSQPGPMPWVPPVGSLSLGPQGNLPAAPEAPEAGVPGPGEVLRTTGPLAAGMEGSSAWPTMHHVLPGPAAELQAHGWAPPDFVAGAQPPVALAPPAEQAYSTGPTSAYQKLCFYPSYGPWETASSAPHPPRGRDASGGGSSGTPAAAASRNASESLLHPGHPGHQQPTEQQPQQEPRPALPQSRQDVPSGGSSGAPPQGPRGGLSLVRIAKSFDPCGMARPGMDPGLCEAAMSFWAENQDGSGAHPGEALATRGAPPQSQLPPRGSSGGCQSLHPAAGVAQLPEQLPEQQPQVLLQTHSHPITPPRKAWAPLGQAAVLPPLLLQEVPPQSAVHPSADPYRSSFGGNVNAPATVPAGMNMNMAAQTSQARLNPPQPPRPTAGSYRGSSGGSYPPPAPTEAVPTPELPHLHDPRHPSEPGAVWLTASQRGLANVNGSLQQPEPQEQAQLSATQAQVWQGPMPVLSTHPSGEAAGRPQGPAGHAALSGRPSSFGGSSAASGASSAQQPPQPSPPPAPAPAQPRFPGHATLRGGESTHGPADELQYVAPGARPPVPKHAAQPPGPPGQGYCRYLPYPAHPRSAFPVRRPAAPPGVASAASRAPYGNPIAREPPPSLPEVPYGYYCPPPYYRRAPGAAAGPYRRAYPAHASAFSGATESAHRAAAAASECMVGHHHSGIPFSADPSATAPPEEWYPPPGHVARAAARARGPVVAPIPRGPAAAATVPPPPLACLGDGEDRYATAVTASMANAPVTRAAPDTLDSPPAAVAAAAAPAQGAPSAAAVAAAAAAGAARNRSAGGYGSDLLGGAVGDYPGSTGGGAPRMSWAPSAACAVPQQRPQRRLTAGTGNSMPSAWGGGGSVDGDGDVPDITAPRPDPAGSDQVDSGQAWRGGAGLAAAGAVGSVRAGGCTAQYLPGRLVTLEAGGAPMTGGGPVAGGVAEGAWGRVAGGVARSWAGSGADGRGGAAVEGGIDAAWFQDSWDL